MSIISRLRTLTDWGRLKTSVAMRVVLSASSPTGLVSLGLDSTEKAGSFTGSSLVAAAGAAVSGGVGGVVGAGAWSGLLWAKAAVARMAVRP